MKYEIAYISQSGNTEKLAHGIADSLPHRDTFVTDLSCEEITGKADVYLIGFGLKKEAIPLKIMDVLEELEGKTILFFVRHPSNRQRLMSKRWNVSWIPLCRVIVITEVCIYVQDKFRTKRLLG